MFQKVLISDQKKENDVKFPHSSAVSYFFLKCSLRKKNKNLNEAKKEKLLLHKSKSPSKEIIDITGVLEFTSFSPSKNALF